MAGVSQSIAPAKNYLRLMDEIYKEASKTSILDTANDRIRFVGANKIELFKTNMDGFADYSRSSGFVKGGVATTWEELTMDKDRGIEFVIDTMDNEEAMGMPIATTLSEFIRTKEVPEVDAYRFAKYASTSNILSANADITIGTTDVPGLIDTAEKAMNDEEVPMEGRILFVSETAWAGLKAKVTRYLANESGVNREVYTFNGMPIIRVPQGRFNTAVTLYDGTSNFGFTPAAGGYKINFLIVHPSAVAQVVKHNPVKIFNPAVNQEQDAWKLQTRLYHGAWVLDNKVKGIYLHRASTANT